MGLMAAPAEFTLPSLLAPTRPSRLSELAAALESRHGPARSGPGQPRLVIESAARKLAQTSGDFSGLDLREQKAALELFWRRDVWAAKPAQIAGWLRWAETDWRPRIAETRICAAMLRHFDPENPATGLVCRWLKERQALLWGRFGDFARRWRLAEGTEAGESIASALAGGDETFLRDLDRNFQAKTTLRRSGFVVAVIEAYALHSYRRTDEDAWAATGALLDLLGPGGLAEAGGPENQRRAAKIAIISRLVDWAIQLASEPAMRRALDLSFRLAADPRESLEEWRDIPEHYVAQVEKWLAPRTLQASFQIVAELGTDESTALQRRRAFWLAYLPHITRVRLVGAPKAARVAASLHEPCCQLKTYLSDHCGFLLELTGEDGRSLTVLELNNLAQALFWPQDRSSRPAFGEGAYDGSFLRTRCDLMLSHLPAEEWADKFADLIAEHTGLPQPGD
jgi:hypothetical protein